MKSDNGDTIVAMVIQAFEADSDSATPIGTWQEMGDAYVKTCDNTPINSTVYENHFKDIIEKTEYSFNWWRPMDLVQKVVFR